HPGGLLRLLVLALAHLRVAGVLRRAAVGHADHAHLVALLGGVEAERAAHAEHLVVRMCREDQDLHPRRAPTGSGSAAPSTSSSTRPPSPHATTAASPSRPTTVPAGASSSRSTGRARQTTSLSSPRNVNAPG